MKESEILIVGADGQLGRALQAQYPEAKTARHKELDITDRQAINNFNWDSVGTIINTAGYTNVDSAETPEGSALAEKINDEAVGYLADIANQKN